MDSSITIMYQVPAGSVRTRENLKVRLSNAYNRKTLPNSEGSIDSVWAERCQANPRLWNGTKFRLHRAYAENTSTVFELGITCYKDFIGSNWSPNAGIYQELGRLNWENSQAYLSDALGVGALVETADNFFILLRRSRHCGEAVGLMDIPGGHPEPQELVGKTEACNINLEALSHRDVVNEIFDSTLREICDEVNVPVSTLSDPQLLGVARNSTSAGRPSSEYYVRCSLPSSEIQQRYNDGSHAEAEESTAIILLPMSRIANLQQDTAIWRELAPSAKGCILLYQLSKLQPA